MWGRICGDLLFSSTFYLQGGQFLGARSDFIPLQICKKLALLQDQVPPMPHDQAKAAIEAELGTKVENVFEWIDLDQPLGSASISQVHKAKLRVRKEKQKIGILRRTWFWLRRKNAEEMRRLEQYRRDTSKGVSTVLEYGPSRDGLSMVSREPIDMNQINMQAPSDGIVAVKIQYPDSLPTMTMDLQNLRIWGAYLSKTEIKFDLLSAVDELAKQIKLEFDFSREARIMNAVASQFDGLGHKICVPRSIPGLVTPRLLVMDFIDGIPITKMKDQIKFRNLSEATKRLAARQILSKVSEAYGRMILLDGLFQADGHPGNMLVMKGGRIGLVDYGQSKRLPNKYRASFARMVLALERKDDQAISEALDGLGIETSKDDVPLKSRLAWGMFDTEGTVNPFDPNSPIKKVSVENFPPDLFFVLRVSQLLRGLANGMNISDFSAAKQWSTFARSALEELGDNPAEKNLENAPENPSLEDFVRMLPIDGYYELNNHSANA